MAIQFMRPPLLEHTFGWPIWSELAEIDCPPPSGLEDGGDEELAAWLARPERRALLRRIVDAERVIQGHGELTITYHAGRAAKLEIKISRTCP